MATALSGARVALSATKGELTDITVSRGRIAGLGTAAEGLDLAGHLILPGLINPHDHLEFNLFPRLGRGPYSNATEWARDVYHPDDPPLREHRRVPKEVRLFWGGIKNLVSGVTTVCHHNPYAPKVFTRRFPVRVLREFAWAHSLAFSPDLAHRYRRNGGDRPFIVHAAEGIDDASREEIARLDRVGALRGSVLVHAVAMDAAARRLVRKRAASVIACPLSNMFTLGRTLDRAAFSSGIRIALGTDSAITAGGDILDALRFARHEFLLRLDRLYRMVTTDAAAVLRLTNGEGAIRTGGVADLIAVRDTGGTPAEVLLDTRRIEMSMIGGRVRLVSDRLAKRLGGFDSFEPIRIAGRGGMRVDANIGDMYRCAAALLGKPRLAGKMVSV